MTYKDKTFCSSDCTVKDCYRFYSKEDSDGAQRWAASFGGKALVAFSDYSKSCPDYVGGRKDWTGAFSSGD